MSVPECSVSDQGRSLLGDPLCIQPTVSLLREPSASVGCALVSLNPVARAAKPRGALGFAPQPNLEVLLGINLPFEERRKAVPKLKRTSLHCANDLLDLDFGASGYI